MVGAHGFGGFQAVGQDIGGNDLSGAGYPGHLDGQQANGTAAADTHGHTGPDFSQVDGMDGHTQRFEDGSPFIRNRVGDGDDG